MFTNACLIATATAAAIAMFPNSAHAQDPGEAGSKITGGITVITDVSTELNRDQIEKGLEDIMKDESCESLAAGKEFYDNNSDYFKGVPFYKETTGQEYQLYIDYFGTKNFVNKYVNAGFSNGSVTYKFKNGADFSKLPGDTTGSGACVGREEGVKKVLGYTLSYIDLIQYQEEAIELLRGGCILVNDLFLDDGSENPSPCKDAVNAWEKAIATYSGSLEGKYGKNLSEAGKYGKWLQALAGKRCANFKTCGATDDDRTNKGAPSRASINIFGLFLQGRDAVFNGRIASVRRIVSEINKEITVTRVQGVLRYAYRTGINKSKKDKEIAEGAAFAFGLLPQIWACNQKSAKFLAANTDIGSDATSQLNGKSVSFSNVRAALECHYGCLGIRFDDVGELNDCVDPDTGGPGLCFQKKADSPNVCKSTSAERKFRNKCKNIAPPKGKNKQKAKTRFGTVAIKRYS
jgi:hypothetical protein